MKSSINYNGINSIPKNIKGHKKAKKKLLQWWFESNTYVLTYCINFSYTFSDFCNNTSRLFVKLKKMCAIIANMTARQNVQEMKWKKTQKYNDGPGESRTCDLMNTIIFLRKFQKKKKKKKKKKNSRNFQGSNLETLIQLPITWPLDHEAITESEAKNLQFS